MTQESFRDLLLTELDRSAELRARIVEAMVKAGEGECQFGATGWSQSEFEPITSPSQSAGKFAYDRRLKFWSPIPALSGSLFFQAGPALL